VASVDGRPGFSAYIVAALQAGARHAELLRLWWADVRSHSLDVDWQYFGTGRRRLEVGVA